MSSASASSSSSAVFRRFSLPPWILRLITRPLRILKSKSLKNKLSLLCSGHEHNSSESPESEGINHYLPQELVQSEFSHSRIPKSNRDWTPQKPANTLYMTIFGEQWLVLWAADTVTRVLFYWAVAFWLIGYWTIPLAANRFGRNVESLTYKGQALLRLVTELTQGVAAVSILWFSLYQYRPLPPDWFRFSLKGEWHLDVILGCLTFPLVTLLAWFNEKLRPPPPAPGPGRRVIRPIVEQSVRARNPVAMVLNLIGVSICAPLWEEILFRGFLMASLTRYMPIWYAIVVSSVVFAIAHLNSRTILPCLFFGMVAAATYSRSRNLVPPILLHSLHNIFVFLGLFK